MANKTQANQSQASPNPPDLKIKKDLVAIEKLFATINDHLTLSSKQIQDFASKIEQAQEAANKFNLKNVKTYFTDIGAALKLPEEALSEFAEKQTKAFDKQATQSFIDNLREIQKLTGLSNDEMLKFSEIFGELGKKFEPKSDLQWWLDDRMKDLGKGSDDKLQSFYDKTLPDSLGKASDAFADLFMGIASGTKSTSDLFSDLGKTLQSVLSGIAADLMRVSMRFLLFGSEKSGTSGLLGGVISGIAGMFSGAGGGMASMSTLNSTGFISLGQYYPSALGNVFAAPALAAYSGSIVAKPTLFPFARGIGLMGEAGAEAIMPLTRGAGGRLGVDASGLGSRAGSPVYVNVVNNMGDSAGVDVRQSQAANGGVNLDVLIEQKMKNSIASGGMDSVMRGRYGARVQAAGR